MIKSISENVAEHGMRENIVDKCINKCIGNIVFSNFNTISREYSNAYDSDIGIKKLIKRQCIPEKFKRYGYDAYVRNACRLQARDTRRVVDEDLIPLIEQSSKDLCTSLNDVSRKSQIQETYL